MTAVYVMQVLCLNEADAGVKSSGLMSVRPTCSGARPDLNTAVIHTQRAHQQLDLGLRSLSDTPRLAVQRSDLPTASRAKELDCFVGDTKQQSVLLRCSPGVAFTQRHRLPFQGTVL